MLITILAYVLVGGFLVIEGRMRQGNEATNLERGKYDQGSTALIGAAYGITIVSLIASALLPQTFPLAFQWFGLALMVAGLGLRFWAFRTLGRFYTRTLRVTEQQQVVQAAPYNLIRHPGYSGSLLLWIGAGIATGNLLVLLIAGIAMGIAYTYRIRTEETMLLWTLGGEYERYRSHTWRLIPLIY